MNEITVDDLFDRRATFPDPGASRRYKALVGIDDTKVRLCRSLGILVNPAGVRKWAKKFHSEELALLYFVDRKPPLVILGGDVGTGKTELATTVADPIARQEDIDITLLPLSLS